MTPSFQRAQLLYHQGRYDLAADALRESLTQFPQDAHAHALLGLCLVHQKKYEDATAEAAMAVHLAPDAAFCHYALGIIFQERNRFPEAESAAREAVRLNPADPDYWALLAQTFLARQRWEDALDAANNGLQFDPEHTTCINLRAMALVKLGDKQAAAQTVAEALQRNPHNAFSHANQGWTLLHQNKPKEALEHFRESLRLNPNNEWARDGTMHALKARYFLYRTMLRYYLWMSRFNRRGRWGIVIGLWLAVQLLNFVKTSYPRLAIVIYPILAAYVLFVLASWLADPIFNLTLMFNPFGRHLLDRAQKIYALIIGTLLLGGLILTPLGYFNDGYFAELAFVVGILMLALTLSVAATSKARPGRHTLIMRLYTLAAASLGIVGIFLMATTKDQGFEYFEASLWACLLSALAANVLLNIIQRH